MHSVRKLVFYVSSRQGECFKECRKLETASLVEKSRNYLVSSHGTEVLMYFFRRCIYSSTLLVLSQSVLGSNSLPSY